MATKPLSKTNWTVGNPDFGVVTIEPTAQKKEDGFFPSERPSRKTFNWILFITDAWIKYFEEVTDTLLVISAGVRIVAASGGTDTTLQAAHDNATAGDKIIVLDDAALASTVNITKANLEIEFRNKVTYSDNGAGDAISLAASANRTIIRGGRFTGFTNAINLNVGADFVAFRDIRFATNTLDIKDNSNATFTAEGLMPE